LGHLARGGDNSKMMLLFHFVTPNDQTWHTLKNSGGLGDLTGQYPRQNVNWGRSQPLPAV
jgi:hypothetical protein